MGQAPFKYDIIGSFLRPTKLKEAREQVRAGELSADQLKAIEDESIRQLIKQLVDHGYPVVTDGEFRRG